MDAITLNKSIAWFRANPSTFLATVAGEEPWLRAMWVARIDDNGTLWYATGLNSKKVEQVRRNPRVSVAGTQGQHGILLFGTAEIVTDPSEKCAIWQEAWTEYFSGEDDPNLALMKITPTRITMW